MITAEAVGVPLLSRAVSGTGDSTSGASFDKLKLSAAAIDRVAIIPVILALNKLRTWGDNWDNAGSLTPNVNAIHKAIANLPQLYEQALATSFPWAPPHISANESGDVVFEWWNRRNKLVIYVSPNDMTFLKVWGTNIDDEMIDGQLDSDTFYRLWFWLNA